jgi:hypothetical protein
MVYPLYPNSSLNLSSAILTVNTKPSFDTVHTDYFNAMLSFRVDIDQKIQNNKLLTDNSVIHSDYLLEVLNNFASVLTENLFNDIKSINNFAWNFVLVWFVIYQIVVACAYIFIWRPIENQLAKDVKIFII